MSKTINKKAYYEYHILKDFISGIQLVGSEVKSMRANNFNMNDAYCYIWDNEVFIKSLYIAKYNESSYQNHEERRDRKLLLTKKEIKDIIKLTKENGITTIPLEIFTLHGRFKVKIGIAKGKKLYDKKEKIKNKDIDREIKRDLNINI
jgi:SsrA-binding protein